jgi:hypothetical protein
MPSHPPQNTVFCGNMTSFFIKKREFATEFLVFRKLSHLIHNLDQSGGLIMWTQGHAPALTCLQATIIGNPLWLSHQSSILEPWVLSEPAPTSAPWRMNFFCISTTYQPTFLPLQSNRPPNLTYMLTWLLTYNYLLAPTCLPTHQISNAAAGRWAHYTKIKWVLIFIPST